ncbi:Gfo/Idh/MocA family protein [Lederbergia citrea]|uniref:Gfo/Idh/MocA family protein n=1 Tax=Lederbergia citrea TaxID=2833581 RepID=UPI001BCA0EBF|nr:Gfo/Idh/MocA family oxidoreductase [Lederbergia citrea]MBS4179281.1 Gfo/Idh/MocA family oxidoreductase [Lederbergia citrea]
MGKINIGIIGLGAVGERLLKQFTAHPETNVTAVSDVNVARLEEMKRDLPEASTYTDYRELLQDKLVDLVYVAVPPKFHHPIVVDVLKAGKHVLCEKPLANSLEEAKEMLELAETAGVVHAINFPLPYSNPVEVLEEKIRGGYIGNLKRVELTMQFPAWPREWQQNPWIAGREQGGFVREITPHYIQLMHQLFGAVKNIHTYIEYPENEAQCETGIIARMELENGVPILVDGLSGIGKKEEINFRMYGDKGVLSLLNWSVLTGSNLLEQENVEIERENARTGLIDELVKAISGERAKLVTFKEGFAVQEVLEKLLELK